MAPKKSSSNVKKTKSLKLAVKHPSQSTGTFRNASSEYNSSRKSSGGSDDLEGFEELREFEDDEDYGAFGLDKPIESGFDRDLEVMLKLIEEMEIQLKTKGGKNDVKFPQFRNFPYDLRIMIWKIVCAEPQVIGVRMSWREPKVRSLIQLTARSLFHLKINSVSAVFGNLVDYTPGPRRNDVFATTRHSPLLTVNKESRKVAKNFYSPLIKVQRGQWPVMADLDVDYLLPIPVAATPWELNEQLAQIEGRIPGGKRIKTVMREPVWAWIKKVMDENKELRLKGELLFGALPAISNSSEIMVMIGQKGDPNEWGISARKPSGISTEKLEAREKDMEKVLDLKALAVGAVPRDIQAENFTCPKMKFREGYRNTDS